MIKMIEKFQYIVDSLINKNSTISIMESCTCGAFTNSITNINNSSKVINFSSIAYSEEFKIKMGVDPRVIKKYSVYSIQTAKEMAKATSNFSSSSIGVGITGHISNAKKNEDNIVYISFYINSSKSWISKVIKVNTDNKIIAKNALVEIFADELIEILNNNI